MEKVLLYSAFCLSLAFSQVCCTETSTEPTSSLPLGATTDKGRYVFSTETVKDTIQITVFNASDSTIFMWFPLEYLDFKQSDGGWNTILTIDTSPLGPVMPGGSASMSTWVLNDDSSLIQGIYSFSGTAFKDSCVYSGCRSISVRSNEFSLTWN
jgi:hypothetical protein